MGLSAFNQYYLADKVCCSRTQLMMHIGGIDLDTDELKVCIESEEILSVIRKVFGCVA